MIGIVQTGRQAMADRYAYVSFWGLFVVVVWLAADLAERFKVSQRAIALVTVAILLGYGSAAYAQLGYWKNSYTLFTHALAVTRDNDIAEENLGDALVQMGRPDLALTHFQREAQLMPQLSAGHYNVATVLQQQGKLAEALPEYQLAIQYGSDPTELAQAHNNLALVLAQSGQLANARKEYDAALALDPNKLNALLGRGILESEQKDFDAARRDFSRALELNPNLTETRRRLQEMGK